MAATPPVDVPGTIQGVYEISGISIVHHTSNGVDGFRVFVDGEDTEWTLPDLDSALAYGLAYRYDGPDTDADIYFMRMIGADE